ncbi:methyltransferase domain-containing protein [Streptomyces sp. SID8361]|uniref:class I SAM-dependent methyltransferase n=1 Tax=Streptomyces sp. MnatMP-M27 TaxID=1839768 RepID=UPI00081F2743|nr:methyltransferase domain-containing protein [Streptomyces sp. MnatMP-M27]MYU12629.1 methyltransferase domain-containing protein [Streptomyces sp. SID8361]SCF93543.1 Methyltransferase domain-containing protein [Streptomyces sp. MnatMP-M27]
MSVENEYASLDPLETRIATHRKFSERADDVEKAVYDHLRERLGTALLDVGCGTGTFLRRLRSWGYSGELTGLDSSSAAVARVRADGAATGVLGQATALPFQDGRFTTVTARHMLYHVPEPEAALREFARVAGPQGQVAVSVNRARTVPGVTALVERQLTVHALPSTSLAGSTDSERLPGIMAEVFPHVRSYSYENALVFPHADALIRFAVAVLGVYGLSVDSTVRRSVIEGIRAEATEWFAANRVPWRDPKGYTICIGRFS